MESAYGYMRVSTIGQVTGDGFTRQENAIWSYCLKNKLSMKQLYKESISGTIENRKELSKMLIDLEDNGVKVVVIERIDRLARDLMVQETIIDQLKKKGIKLISVADGDLLEDDPTRKLVRQVLGAIAEYDKTMTVLKLQVARERIREATGKCEGRKSYLEINPEVLEEIKRLRRKPRNGKRLPLKYVVNALNNSGFKTATGQEFTVQILKNIIYRK